MIDFKTNMVNKISGDLKWSLLEKLFNKNYPSKGENKIPKTIHQIWLGSELPEISKYLRDRMMNINRNWDYKLWGEEEIQKFGLKNSELYNNIKNYGAKSDIARYEILQRLGGIYIDTDFDCVKPFDDLCGLDFFAGNGHISEPEVFNSIIGSMPDGKIINSYVEGLLGIKTFNDNIDGVMNTTGPYYITRQYFSNTTSEDNSVIFPTKFFFPFPAIYRHQTRDYKNPTIEKYVKSFVNENTYCIHLWHTAWQK